ncbi:hypothetical protein Si036_00391 [Streptococcus infantarius subsp. infantarius]|jgi:predicted Zn-dependent protease|nr:hypothetical protein [Streptococcus infantarius subsp. infantarius]
MKKLDMLKESIDEILDEYDFWYDEAHRSYSEIEALEVKYDKAVERNKELSKALGEMTWKQMRHQAKIKKMGRKWLARN